MDNWVPDFEVRRCANCDHGWGTYKNAPILPCPKCERVEYFEKLKQITSGEAISVLTTFAYPVDRTLCNVTLVDHAGQLYRYAIPSVFLGDASADKVELIERIEALREENRKLMKENARLQEARLKGSYMKITTIDEMRPNEHPNYEERELGGK